METIEQGSQEWLEIRLGKITASKISDVLAKGKGNAESLTRNKYKNQLIRERLTKKVIPSYSNDAMERGTLLEPIARASYEIKFDKFVEQVPFINHPLIENAGASPDGLIDKDGLIEIKCPNPETHLDYILTEGESLKTRYYNQIQWQLACCGDDRKWVDLVSFDPDMIDELQLCVIRVPRDEEYIKTMEAEVIKFDDEVTKTILNLKETKCQLHII
jgi:putative phage-type endonuclease